MNHRPATRADLDLLARWNHELIEDEQAQNPMSVPELKERMRAWLTRRQFAAVIFETAGEPVAYALFREHAGAIFLRHFFVRRGRRRARVGAQAMALLEQTVWADAERIVLEVLVHNTRGLSFWQSMGFHGRSLTMVKGDGP